MYVTGGDLALETKYYLTPQSNEVSLYALGGPGLLLLHRTSTTNQIYNENTQARFDEVFPEVFLFSPSAQAGLGFTVESTEEGRIFLEYRMTYAFLSQPVLFGTANFGLLWDL
jgi:hypothetical protein